MNEKRTDESNYQSEIMTLTDMAKYLKISEKTILRMVRRGDMPGTKISNQWRFQRTIVDNWLTGHMHGASNTDLVDVLRTSPSLLPVPKLITSQRIIMNIEPADKPSILKRLIEPLTATGIIIDAEKFLADLIEREEMVSTAIGSGFALPHKSEHDDENVMHPSMVLGICRNGTDFDSLDNRLTYLFVLLCSPSTTSYLRMVAKTVLMLRQPDIVNKFRNCTNKDEVMDILLHAHFDLSIRF